VNASDPVRSAASEAADPTADGSAGSGGGRKPAAVEGHSGVRYAPHRRGSVGSVTRVVQRSRERVVVHGYLLASAAIARVSPRISEPVARSLFRAGYYGWPAKRRIIHANASHVLGRPADDAAVGRLARRIYATYSRFALELMQLPHMPGDEPTRLLHPADDSQQRFLELWARCSAEGRGVIVTSGHIGSIEIFAAAYALQGIPTYGLADDSAYPELFAVLNQQRARWGVHIIPWRNLREIFRVMRKPAVMGMVVDWGYRPEDVPVRFFGAWTTLPAGPATLAARCHAAILPVASRRQPDGTYRATATEAIELADGSPREILRATQAIADALEAMVREAPDQWFCFKPMWPATQAEADALAARALAMATA
jgi:KDO2-lipid IV(A) lauroyltransferase